jgi:hypothetical protein
MRAIRLGLMWLCLMTSAALANGADSPEVVVRAFLAALHTDGVAATVARFTHPDECARFKAMVMPRIRKGFDDPSDKFSEEIPGRKMSLESIEALSPTEFMAAFLRRSQVDGSAPAPQFLSSTREGDVVHLVVLTELKSLEGKPTQRRDVISLKAFGDSWKMMLSRELEAYATVLVSEVKK